MSGLTALESVLRRDRIAVVGALTAVIVASWLYILAGAGMGMSAFEMTAMSGSPAPAPMDRMAMAMTTPAAWSIGYAVVMLLMWWIMMVAMMLPSAAPMILFFAAINRKQRERAAPFVPTGVFAAGYVLVWGGFSVAAVALQWGLERSGLLSPMMVSTSAVVGGLLLLAAGIYQLTPLKDACLRHCRSPLSFIMGRWRPGRRGALMMGIEHGAYCTGCCWVLMALLFYGGVMNLYWIAGLAILVLLEKVAPAGHWVGRVSGVGLTLWGGAVLAAAL